MSDLANSLEGGEVERQRELLMEAYKAIHPEPPMRRRRGDDWHEWVDGYNRFYAMLKAEAYVDAAMMLIPAGWERDIVDADNGDCIAQLQTDDQQAWARAKTWGLAIAAAALRARSHTDGETSHV